MEVRIANNKDGTIAEVNKDSQLSVISENIDLGLYTSFFSEDTYHVFCSVSAASGTTTVMNFKNEDTTKICVIAELEMQLVGTTTTDSAATYFEIGFDRTISSGGTTVTATNQNRASGNTANVSVTNNGPTMTGTFISDNKIFPTSSSAILRKTGRDGTILGLNDTMEIRLVTDNTSGLATVHTTFIMLSPDSI